MKTETVNAINAASVERVADHMIKGLIIAMPGFDPPDRVAAAALVLEYLKFHLKRGK